MIVRSRGLECTSWTSTDGTHALAAYASAGHRCDEVRIVLDAILDVGRASFGSRSGLSERVVDRLTSLYGAGEIRQDFWTFALASVEITGPATECVLLGTFFQLWRCGSWILGCPPESIIDRDNVLEVTSWRVGEPKPTVSHAPVLAAQFPVTDVCRKVVTNVANYKRAAVSQRLSIAAESDAVDAALDALFESFHEDGAELSAVLIGL